MNKSFYYLKKLTAAEVGTTKAHVGGYIRLPNDFDYESFFLSKGEDNNGVQEIIFSAYNLCKNVMEENLRFAYFKSSNQEKRIPNLAVLFNNNDVVEGDVVKLESRIIGNKAHFFIQFFKNSDVVTKSTDIYYCIEESKGFEKDGLRSYNSIYDYEINNNNLDIISALRAKPFILLAGISGTGKSRKVQELAYLTCKRDGIHDMDETAPGNYMLIPVKPNWHDSTELLGYYSTITGKYVLTDFIRFVWKAWVHKDVPYFLCLDEMNLAPVEQYFAEYLSILETRKLVYDEEKKEWHIQTAEILSKKIFENLTTEIQKEPNDKVITYNGMTSDPRPEIKQLYKGDDIQIINFLKKNGLRLPENLFVIGTVNMDDTTHQFSRKVIDRAFTIEMNGDELTKMFDAKDTLAYLEDPMTIDEIRPLFVKAQEVLEAYPSDANTIKTFVPEFLNRINGEGIFKDTPFRVSYRVQNELVLYYASIRPQGDLTPDQIIPYLQEAFMAILLEKILPRVEGDEKAMKCNEKGDSTILLKIKQYLNEMKPIEGEPSPTFNTLIKKLDEMNERVKNSYFTSFFS
jgi:hypothetical protein